MDSGGNVFPISDKKKDFHPIREPGIRVGRSRGAGQGDPISPCVPFSECLRIFMAVNPCHRVSMLVYEFVGIHSDEERTPRCNDLPFPPDIRVGLRDSAPKDKFAPNAPNRRGTG